MQSLLNIFQKMSYGADTNSIGKGMQKDGNYNSVKNDLIKVERFVKNNNFFVLYQGKVKTNHYLYKFFVDKQIPEETTFNVESFDVAFLFKTTENVRESAGVTRKKINLSPSVSSPCSLFCNCPHFKFYYEHADKSFLLGKREISSLNIKEWEWEPKTNQKRKEVFKNPKNEIGVCKHIVSFVNYLLTASMPLLTSEEIKNIYGEEFFNQFVETNLPKEINKEDKDAVSNFVSSKEFQNLFPEKYLYDDGNKVGSILNNSKVVEPYYVLVSSNTIEKAKKDLNQKEKKSRLERALFSHKRDTLNRFNKILKNEKLFNNEGKFIGHDILGFKTIRKKDSEGKTQEQRVPLSKVEIAKNKENFLNNNKEFLVSYKNTREEEKKARIKLEAETKKFIDHSKNIKPKDKNQEYIIVPSEERGYDTIKLSNGNEREVRYNIDEVLKKKNKLTKEKAGLEAELKILNDLTNKNKKIDFEIYKNLSQEEKNKIINNRKVYENNLEVIDSLLNQLNELEDNLEVIKKAKEEKKEEEQKFKKFKTKINFEVEEVKKYFRNTVKSRIKEINNPEKKVDRKNVIEKTKEDLSIIKDKWLKEIDEVCKKEIKNKSNEVAQNYVIDKQNEIIKKFNEQINLLEKQTKEKTSVNNKDNEKKEKSSKENLTQENIFKKLLVFAKNIEDNKLKKHNDRVDTNRYSDILNKMATSIYETLKNKKNLKVSLKDILRENDNYYREFCKVLHLLTGIKESDLQKFVKDRYLKK